jgi:hypothetical protein
MKNCIGLTDVVILTLNKTRNLGNTLLADGTVTLDLSTSVKETLVYLLTPTH